MNLKEKVRLYKAYLEDLINTINEEKGIENIKGLDRESFIQNIIDAFSVRSSIEKYFNKSYLNEDLLLLELDKSLRKDKEIYNFFNGYFEKYKPSKKRAVKV